MVTKSRYLWLTAACAAALVATGLQLRVFTQDAPQKASLRRPRWRPRRRARTVQPGARGPVIGGAGDRWSPIRPTPASIFPEASNRRAAA
jgi:hypothetical protein